MTLLRPRLFAPLALLLAPALPLAAQEPPVPAAPDAAPAAAAALSPQAAGDELRREFSAALAAAEAGAAPLPESDNLRAYVLYPYLVAARLLEELARAPTAATDTAVLRFLEQEPDLPPSRELRRQHLLSLARREAWAEYLARYVEDPQDPTLVCHRYRARIVTGDTPGLREQLLAFWSTAPQMPQACVAPFRWLQEQGAITPAAAEQRVRKALADGNLQLVDWLLPSLPAPTAAPLRQWARLLRDPGPELQQLAAQPDLRSEWPALLAGYSKLARRDSAAARSLLSPLEARLPPEQAGELLRWSALGLAWDRQPEALEAFRRLPAPLADNRVHEWRIRAALWQGDLELAAQWLHELPPELAAESRWTYWRARTLEVLGRSKQSLPIYRTLSQENGYYSVLSAWRLGLKYQPRVTALAPDPVLQMELQRLPGIVRARELQAIGRNEWATAEWRNATRPLDVARRQQAGLIAASWGWHPQAVGTLNQAGAPEALVPLYPEAYTEELRSAAQRSGLAPIWLYGVMRQESLFDPRARSRADAFGLLQLLLPTAQAVARRNALPAPGREDLFRPEVNIPLGAAYLAEMRARFGGQLLPALAAYNAGPNAVARWLPARPMEIDFWVENIPYNETRGYVQKILWNIAVAGWRGDGQAQDLSALLVPVQAPVAAPAATAP